jgi:hypothetical protein
MEPSAAGRDDMRPWNAARTFGLVVGCALCATALVAGCGGEATSDASSGDTGTSASTDAARSLAEFGYIKSLTRSGSDFELRFDPAWLLTGETANAAAAEDGAVEPGQPVPNDAYVVDEGHRILTYVVPPDARVSVLADGPGATAVTVAELAQIVAGDEPLGHPLFEPITTGFWIEVEVDTVRSLVQQYRP